MYNNIALTNGSYYRLEQGSYAVADLMAGYQVNKHLDLQVNANNSLTAPTTRRPAPAQPGAPTTPTATRAALA